MSAALSLRPFRLIELPDLRDSDFDDDPVLALMLRETGVPIHEESAFLTYLRRTGHDRALRAYPGSASGRYNDRLRLMAAGLGIDDAWADAVLDESAC